jgi:hypothetical protein
MGKVTNAYPEVRNYTRHNLSKDYTTLSASDEALVNPDKTACVAELPAGNQVSFKVSRALRIFFSAVSMASY